MITTSLPLWSIVTNLRKLSYKLTYFTRSHCENEQGFCRAELTKKIDEHRTYKISVTIYRNSLRGKDAVGFISKDLIIENRGRRVPFVLSYITKTN